MLQEVVWFVLHLKNKKATCISSSTTASLFPVSSMCCTAHEERHVDAIDLTPSSEPLQFSSAGKRRHKASASLVDSMPLFEVDSGPELSPGQQRELEREKMKSPVMCEACEKSVMQCDAYNVDVCQHCVCVVCLRDHVEKQSLVGATPSKVCCRLCCPFHNLIS